MIPYGRQDISEDDIEAVVAVLRSDWLTQGPATERFEREFADYCGTKHAVAVSSATAALHIACLSAGLGRGDSLWTSPNTFVASSNCALYCDAEPDFVDIDPSTGNMSAAKLEEKLEQTEKIPKIIVPVHFAGQSCEMEKIAQLSKKYGFIVIEDASHAAGGKYRGIPIGSCSFSDMAIFSFHPVKIVTTGEGGMVLTNRDDLYEKLIRLRSHGITRNPAFMEMNEGSWYYEQIELGYNYRMTDIQAALGSSQMRRLDEFVKRRHALAKRYEEKLSGLPLVPLKQLHDAHSSHHLYVVRLDAAKRRKVFEALRAAGIGVNVHYIPVHLQPYYRELGFEEGEFPEAEKYYSEAITLPLYPSMTDLQQDHVVQSLSDALRQ